MGIKYDSRCRPVEPISLAADAAKQSRMPQMHAVEITDRDDATAHRLGQSQINMLLTLQR